MLLLLALAGAAIAFGVGVAVGRARCPVDVERGEPTPSTMVAPSFTDLCDLFRSGVVVADATGVVTHRNAAAQALGGTHAGLLLDEVIERHVGAAAEGLASDEVLEMYGPPKAVLAIVSQPIPSAPVKGTVQT